MSCLLGRTMWRLIFILILLFDFFGYSQNITTKGERQFPGLVRVYGDIYSNDKGIDKSVITATTSAISLYVATTGSDSNTCLSLLDPCLTIQKAINKVPKDVQHNVNISVGEGNFAGFYLFGFRVRRDATFVISGTLNNPTLTTGTTSGTATGGTTTTLIDAGQSWTVNELRGKLVYVNSDYRVIRSNDATSFETIGPSSSTMNGKAYTLYTQKTIINSPQALYSTYRIFVHGNLAMRDNLRIADLKITGGTSGLYAHDTQGFNMRRLWADATTGTSGLLIQSSFGEFLLEDIFTSNNATYGIAVVEQANQCRMTRIFAFNNGNMGMFLYGPGSYPNTNTDFYVENTISSTYAALYVGAAKEFFITRMFLVNNAGAGMSLVKTGVTYITNATITNNGKSGLVHDGVISLYASNISSNGEYGISVGGIDAFGYTVSFGTLAVKSATTVSSNTLGGVYLRNKSIGFLPNVSGAANGTYGVIADYGASAYITSTTTVTGATNDVLVGTTAGAYAIDFAADLSSILDSSEGTLIKRRDGITF